MCSGVAPLFSPSPHAACLSLQSQEKSILQNERLLADLKKRSPHIAPLKLRRSRTSKPVSVESLCDWDNGKVSATHRRHVYTVTRDSLQ